MRDRAKGEAAGEDRDLGCDQRIDRRDFLNGIAIGVGALGALSPSDLLRDGVLDRRAAATVVPED